MLRKFDEHRAGVGTADHEIGKIAEQICS